ncbi:MAG: glycosyltransferase [candidate division Zixibacteria bacterium]
MTDLSGDKYHICMFSDERSIHARRWVQGLRNLGNKVDLITLIKEDKYDIGGISLNARGKLSYLSKISKLKKLVAKINPDIFHAHYASSYGFLASFVTHPRKILSVWGNDVIVFPYENFVFKLFVRRALKKADCITATSHFLVKAVKMLNPDIENIRIIAFGIDINQFRFSERPARDIVEIGIAKSLWPKYGIDILLKAFKELSVSYKNIRLSIAGKGKYKEEYVRMVDELRISDLVKFEGFIDHKKLQDYFSRIDIFAMPSISDGESFGVAAIEASSTGLPVVVSEVGGVPEVVVDGKTGFLVQRKNVSELAKALEKLINDPNLRSKMGKAGRKFVENNYKWEDNLHAMQDLYAEMMK